MVVDVELEERYWYPDDGGIVWLAGYQPIAADGRFLARGAPELRAAGLTISGVAGARFNAQALNAEEASPGRPLRLRRDTANEHDANAIAVDLPGGAQLGWVPRELAAELAPELDAGHELAAVALREQRPSPREPRTGVTMLIARAGELELRVR